MRFVFLTMEGTHSAALREAADTLRRVHAIDLTISLHNTALLRSDADWQRLTEDAAHADFIFGARLFGEDCVRAIERALATTTCPICIITSNPALINKTRLGKFILHKDEGQEPGLLMQWMRKLRPKGGQGEARRQLAVLRNLSKVLKHIPGKARDLHTYLAAHQYWLNNSSENLVRLLCLLIERYVPGYKGRLPVKDPLIYPDTALFHPDAPQTFPNLASYQKWYRNHTSPRSRGAKARQSAIGSAGTVGMLSLRTVALSGNTAHLDALTHALEARGIAVRMAYSAGLDARPALEQFFMPQGQREIDLLINGTGFSLVGGPAEGRPEEARVALEQLDVSCIDLIPLAFQRVEEWQGDDTGLVPIQLSLNVALPELDGAIEPLVIGGPTAGSDKFVALPKQVDLAASRIARHVALRRTANAEKRLAVVIFSFPPNLGNIGTAAYLDVFGSLHKLLLALQADGYDVTVPEHVEALRQELTVGNALAYGTDGNVADRLPVQEYQRLFPAYTDIEPFWGRAPGDLLTDGKSFYILGKQFGKVFVGIQPGFGYERDPMRLLMAKDVAPHHGFAAFYAWIEHVFAAHAVIHFGTHGALEFMPGKQAGLSSTCWPTRLLGTMPNFYYYSVNNPSEGTIAKRRGAATLVSYMVPPLQNAGLYKGLRLLKDSLDSYRQHPSPELLADIRLQAEKLNITEVMGQHDNAESDTEAYVAALAHELIQIEQRMIPVGLHVLGQAPAEEELIDILALVTTFKELPIERDALRNGQSPAQLTLPRLVALSSGWDYETIRDRLKVDREAQERWERINTICREAMRLLVAATTASKTPSSNATSVTTHAHTAKAGERFASIDAYLQQEAQIKPGTLAPLWAFLTDLLGRIVADQELQGMLHALQGGYVLPSPGNDVVRNPAVVPTGRNIYGLDPFRMPSAVAQDASMHLVRELLERLTAEQGALPESVAVVLWGIDNLKSDGEGIAQVLALLGVRIITDELGNVSDVALIPLSELGRPRIDVVVTVSGIFRDLLHHQMGLMDKAVHLAAHADEPLDQNFVRKHVLAHAVEMNIDIDEAATRIFANAPGNYGANVNFMVESSAWDQDDQLSDAFLSRKSFAFSAQGQKQWRDARSIMEKALTTVDATFQNIDSFEVGISDIDNYYENLGGITKSVETLRGKRPPVLVADAVASTGRLSSLEQMVRLETRAKLLNPKWFEGMLAHGTEGVREIEARVNNTYGWSATAAAVEDWVYQGVVETFLLDETMRDRMAQLNPHATAAVARRLLEANSRGFWEADEATLAALHEIYDDLEDRLEGIGLSQSSSGQR